MCLADIRSDLKTARTPSTLAEGYTLILHGDERGVNAVGSFLSCLGYTNSSVPQFDVSGCEIAIPVARSLAVAVSQYNGLLRVGIDGVFNVLDVPSVSLRDPALCGQTLTLRVGYAAATRNLSVSVHAADGAPLPQAAAWLQLQRPLSAIVGGQTAVMSLAGASGFYQTMWIATALGFFSAALQLPLPSPEPSPSRPAPLGSIVMPLLAAAAMAAGALMVAQLYRRQRRRRAQAERRAGGETPPTGAGVVLAQPLLASFERETGGPAASAYSK